MKWKTFTIVIASLAGVAGLAKLVIACADGPSPYEYQSFFLNTVNKQPAFVPFYYTPDLNFYSDGWEFAEYGVDCTLPDPNAAMWQAYTGNEVPLADLDSFVYTFSANDVANLAGHVNKDAALAVPRVVSSNAFTKWLLKHKDAAALQYLAFAKKCEPYARAMDAEWNSVTQNYAPPAIDTTAMLRLENEARQKCAAQAGKDLKLRYAYQALRMCFYSRHYARTAALYNELITERQDNFLFYRCLALKAGAQFHTGAKVTSAYFYSLIFDNTDDNKEKNYTSFRWAVNGKIAPVLALCKNNHEKAVVYLMQGLYDYDHDGSQMTDALAKAYELDPQVKGIDILMTRNINKLESDLVRNLPRADKKPTALVSRQLAGLNAFAQKAAQDGKCGSRAFWYLCSSYLYLLGGSNADCKKYLDQAAAEKMQPHEEEVFDNIKVLYVMRKDPKITDHTEAELLPLLKAMEQKAKNRKVYANVFQNMMLTVMKAEYMAQGDTAKAVFCYSKVNYEPWSDDDFTNEAGKILEAIAPGNMDKVESFIAKAAKTPFEKWLTGRSFYNIGVLKELEGTKYIRMCRFDKAVAVLSEIPDSLLRKHVLPDMLVSHILDGMALNKSDSLSTYNKLTFARKMAELQQTLEKDPANGRAAYQYANGLYSMSYYGKGHHAYDYYRTVSDDYDLSYYNFPNRARLAAYQQDHYTLLTPQKYYIMAFENSTDREVKARCLFMAAKCWQKNCPIPAKNKGAFYGDERVYYRNTFANPYLLQLKSSFSDTRFYASARGTCTYFADFVKKN